MDKWKDAELAKMKAGGNKKAKVFLESYDDWDPDSPITVKYNSRAAALYKDKVNCTGFEAWTKLLVIKTNRLTKNKYLSC